MYSPMSGTVSKLDVELGERVVGTSQFAGTEMLRIAQLSQMELEVDVNENDVVNVSNGDSAKIEVDAYPERFFRGVVTQIANSARVTGAGTQEQVTNFPVKIRLLDPHNIDVSGSTTQISTSETEPDDPVPNFRPGMSGTVDIFTRTVDDVIAVPIQAVTIRDLNQIKREALRRERRGSRSEDAEADSVDWEALEELPQASVQVHVRSMSWHVPPSPGRTTSSKTTVGSSSHSSRHIASPVFSGSLDSSGLGASPMFP